MRECLDPVHGEDLALPPDAELLADLCAPRYRLTASGILLEAKEEVVRRLGRSPDAGDAVVLCNWWRGVSLNPAALTLGYGLNDSPAGLAAWIVDKFWAASDHGGNLENSFSKDELLTNVMIYWVTQSMPSSTRIYYETVHNLPRPKSMTPFASKGKPAPLGFALFPKEIRVPPRDWVEREMGGKLLHWTEMPRGGHFAALEQPKLLVEDVRNFFWKVR